jgi:probable F420-dependent oxidoreductase
VRLGFSTEIAGLSLRQAVDLCVQAERSGYDSAWSSESGGPDGITPLAAIATRTSRIRLGTAILPIAHRTAALTAMTAASLQELSDGRFVLGLGVSSRYIVERWLGQSRDRPLTRLREYVTVVRDLLDGRRVDFAGATLTVRGFRLPAAPRHRVPVFVAALGPGACRLAGGMADGVIFFLKTPAGVKQARAWVHEGAVEAGRDPADVECVLTVLVVPEADGLDRARGYVASYVRVPDYARSLRLQGFDHEVDAVLAAWADGADRAREAVSPALAAGLVLRLGADTGPAAAEAFGAAGADTLVLLPVRASEDAASGQATAERVLTTFAPRLDAGVRG